jgi:ribonuclease P protein component
MFPCPNRLRLDKDIKALFAKGRGVFDVCAGLKVRPNGLAVTRFAVVVGTKVSKRAVVRNRLRRQIREAIRLRLGTIKPGFDVMVLVRKEAIGKTFQDLERHVTDGLKKAKIL